MYGWIIKYGGINMNQTELRRTLSEKTTKKGMTVQELFRHADPTLAAYAFMVSRPVNEDRVLDTLRSKTEDTLKYVLHAQNEIEKLSKIDIQNAEEHFIFIWEKTCLLGEPEEIFVYHDAIALTVEDIDILIDCNCNLWDERTIRILESNHLYNCSIEELASFNVPQPIIDKYGIDVCCGLLLQYTECYSTSVNRCQEKYINKIKEYICEPVTNDGTYINRLKHNIFFAPHNKDIVDYRLITHAYNKSVADIVQRLNKKTIQDDFDKLIRQICVSLR